MSIQRRVALIGPGEGPWISTQGLLQPRAKITGLKEGGQLTILQCDDPKMFHRETPVMINENGVFELREAHWTKVACIGGGKNVICDILTKKAVA